MGLLSPAVVSEVTFALHMTPGAGANILHWSEHPQGLLSHVTKASCGSWE